MIPRHASRTTTGSFTAPYHSHPLPPKFSHVTSLATKPAWKSDRVYEEISHFPPRATPQLNSDTLGCEETPRARILPLESQDLLPYFTLDRIYVIIDSDLKTIWTSHRSTNLLILQPIYSQNRESHLLDLQSSVNRSIHLSRNSASHDHTTRL